jgi:zinc transport system substrate-binding protein
VDASVGLPLIRSSGEDAPNPHLWLGVTLHIGQVSNIVAQLARIDPPRAAQFRRNGDAYIARLALLRTEVRDGLQDLRQREIVTFHDAFAYFAREFDLRVAAVIAHAPEAGASARDLARTIDRIRQSRAAAIFAEPQYPAASAEAIARETGLPLRTLDPAVTGPAHPDAYLRIMRQNLAELQQALNR